MLGINEIKENSKKIDFFYSLSSVNRLDSANISQ